MNSAEIRNTLKPMADFAPAVLRCAEIVEAAEAAEKKLKGLDGEIDAKQKEIAKLETETVRFRESAQAARQSAMAMLAEGDEKMEAMRAVLINAKLEADQMALAINKQIDDKRGELKAINVEVEEAKQRLAKVQKSLEDWAKKNSLKVA